MRSPPKTTHSELGDAHLAILNAISLRDSAGARAAMRVHLTNSQTHYSARMYERQANYATGITDED